MEQELQEYNGVNPFLLHLKSKILKYELSEFEKEYVGKNLRYSGCGFNNLKLVIGRRNMDYLNQQFGTNKEFSEITIDFLYGETKEMYHFSYKKRAFWVYLDDCENPFKKEIQLVPFDPTPYDCHNLWGRTLYPHQIEGIKFMKAQNPAFNWDSCGLGKTTMAIVTALDNGYKRILVVTLASLKLNWRREIENYHQTTKIISGSDWDSSPSTFTIINYEILKNFVRISKSKNIDNATNDLLNQNYDCIILDEIHRCKNVKSIQSQCVKALCSTPSVKKIMGLSGTSI